MMQLTPEQVTEFKRELSAVDGLLAKLMPEDDLSRLALDPKRQHAAAQMVGTVTLARDVLAKAYKRLDEAPVKGNGKPANPRAGHGVAMDWITKHAPTDPIKKSVLVNKGVAAAGLCQGNLYHAINKLIASGVLKQTEKENGAEIRRV